MAHAPIRVSVTAMHLKQWKFKYVDETLAEKNLEDSFVQTLAKHLVFGVDFLPSDNFWVGLGYNPKANMDMKLKEGETDWAVFRSAPACMYPDSISVHRWHVIIRRHFR